MRQRLIEALTYPRMLVSDIIGSRGCPNGERFESECESCRNCVINGQCHWVSWLQDCGNLRDRPAHTLNASLRYGIRLVREFRDGGSHDEIACGCESCAWIRLSERLVAEFESTLPPNRFRGMH